MARQEALTSYAAERAELLFGCYRTGDANDPKVYVAAVTAVLARYPEQVITEVTHPVTGLPSNGKGWLPTVKEVSDACARAHEPIIQGELRLKRIKEQMEARERMDRGEKPTLEQLKARFGENWGLDKVQPEKTQDEKREENRAAMDREQARVRAEYNEAGAPAPASKLALSIEARRLIAQQDELRQAAKQAAE
ncbi:hypothetical protein JQ633_00995 [Bradyrhizobium tropiciagri]|uniref:hypothetical protein n=1 Tax=Bradyrhizobium tropiciagri TaxID=312253 RepID=UPI001BAE137E|nr:hypothetical protein [Bradyrhizobium tropiciagri]MBR0868917.1 hypothetical protein [Bradyrhizobium tropiciagri]